MKRIHKMSNLDTINEHDAISLGIIDNGNTFVRMIDGWGAVTTEQIIAGVVCAEMTTAGALTVSSANANDTGAGTGARTVTVYGLDANWNRVQDTVTLNGQTAVTLPTVVLHPYLLIVNTAGSGGTNAGILYVGSGTITSGQPAVVNCGLSVSGINQSRMAFMPVPAGYKAVIQDFYVNSSSSSIDATFYPKYKPFGGVWLSSSPIVVGTKSNRDGYIFSTPALPEKTLIKISGKSASTSLTLTTHINVNFYKYK